MFYAILVGVPLLNLLWWLWADSRLRTLPSPRRWRLLLAAFMLFQLSIYAWSIASRALDLAVPTPVVPLAAAYVWHLIVLPFTMIFLGLVTGGYSLGRGAAWVSRFFRPAPAPALVPALAGETSPEVVEPQNAPAPASGSSLPAATAAADPLVLSRRQFLAAAAVAAPPLVTGGGVIRGLSQLDDFRIRRIELPLPGLPRELDGLTVAHITDVHVGRYTHGPVLRRIAERTNDLRADLTVLTGDLIDHDLADLPAALDMVRRLDSKAGVFMCEGNHDLFESREAFETAVPKAGIPLLLNDAQTVKVRGREVEVLGLKWGRPGAGRAARRDAAIDAHLQEALTRRNPDAFPILLAHHPHAFDPAAAAGLPLTLAGHTHGGQLMLTDQVGLAQLAFKYWSGVYRQGNSAMVVSNGVGNWFPLRINAPAEVIHLTLRSATA